jgi:hypothetical protein
VLVGADQETVARASPAEALAPVGAPGTPRGVADTAEDAVPFPLAFTALILTEYAVPFVRPVITKGEAVVPDARLAQAPPSKEYW